MYDLIVVIAGSLQEAEKWASLVSLKQHQWLYLHNVKTIEGQWKRSKFAAVGTWRLRDDYHQIRLYVNVIEPKFARGWEFHRQIPPYFADELGS